MNPQQLSESVAFHRLVIVLVALLAAAAVAAGLVVGGQHTQTREVAGGSPQSREPVCVDHGAAAPRPTIVLVHGAFADASGWSGVVARLEGRGFTVFAPPNPLRGLASDAAYLRTFLGTVAGPVVLVGHSYGGAVITNAARGDDRVKALVYVAALALDTGETAVGANSLGGHPEVSLLQSNLRMRPLPGGTADKDVYIDPGSFRRVFAADLSARRATAMAVGQRPVTQSALNDPSGAPAWKDKPSWYVVARQDRAIPPAAERFMARRAGSMTTEVNSSHAVMVSRPARVTGVIREAAAAARCRTALDRVEGSVDPVTISVVDTD